jgi:exonuclease III
MIKPLKIVTWNANRLVKHSQDIKTFIFNQNIDILFVSERHFRIIRVIAVFLKYHTMHLDDKAHGGTALIIRSDIKYEIDKYQKEFLQTTSIWYWNGCITISAVYSLSTI